MSEPQTVQIAPQAALNEYAALSTYYRDRNLSLAQAIHDLSATVETLRSQLAEAEAALEAELSKEEISAGEVPVDGN